MECNLSQLTISLSFHFFLFFNFLYPLIPSIPYPIKFIGLFSCWSAFCQFKLHGLSMLNQEGRGKENLFPFPLSICKGCEVGPCWGMLSEEVCEPLQMSHQSCIRNLSITVHVDESFVKIGSECLLYWIYSVLEKNVYFNPKEFMEDLLYSKHLR